MTLEQLSRAQWLVTNIRHVEQNSNQETHVDIRGNGGWNITQVPAMNEALAEIEKIGNQIMQAQARQCLTDMKTELLALGVTT